MCQLSQILSAKRVNIGGIKLSLLRMKFSLVSWYFSFVLDLLTLNKAEFSGRFVH